MTRLRRTYMDVRCPSVVLRLLVATVGLSGVCLAQPPESVQDRVARWVAELASEDAAVRAKAAESLGRSAPLAGGKADVGSVVRALSQVLDDGDTAVRKSVARALGQIAESTRDGNTMTPAIQPLMAVAAEHGRYGTRGLAAWALGRIANRIDPGAAHRVIIAPLLSALKSEDKDTRGSAASALRSVAYGLDGVAPMRPAIPHLMEALRDEATDGDSAQALAEIARVADIEVSRALILVPLAEMLRGDDASRKSAAEALQVMSWRIEDRQATALMVDALIPALSDELDSVRYHAATGLAGVASKSEEAALLSRAVDPLIAVLQGDRQVYIRCAAARALMFATQRLPDQPKLSACIEPLLTALDEDERVTANHDAYRAGVTRRHAATALGNIAFRATQATELTAAVPRLTRATDDKDYYVRARASMALMGIAALTGDHSALPEAFQTLITAMAHPNPPGDDRYWRSNVAGLPRQFRLASRPCDQTALAEITAMAITALNHEDADIRAQALVILERIGTPEARAAVAGHRAREGE